MDGFRLADPREPPKEILSRAAPALPAALWWRFLRGTRRLARQALAPPHPGRLRFARPRLHQGRGAPGLTQGVLVQLRELQAHARIVDLRAQGLEIPERQGLVPLCLGDLAPRPERLGPRPARQGRV